MKQAIVLGGTDDHIHLIKILRLKNYKVCLIDYYENPPAASFADEHIQESTLDKEKVLQIAQEKNADLVVSACIDQALLTMAYVCERLHLPCHVDYNTALELTNKAYMKNRLQDNDIPTSKFYIVGTSQESDVANQLSYPLVVKPVDTNSSKGVEKVFNKDGLLAAVDNALSLSNSKKAVIEEYFDGDEFSVDVIIKDGKASLVMATQNIKNPENKKNFTITQNMYPASTDPVVLQKIQHIAQQITDAYQLKNTPLLIQMLLGNNDEIRVIEFSSRIGGGSKCHFINAVTGFDIVEYFVDILVGGGHADIPSEAKYRYGLMNYIYTKPGVVEEYKGFSLLKEKGIIEEYFLYKTTGTQIGSALSSTDRAAGFMVVDNDYEKFQQKIKTTNSTIQIIDNNGEDIKI